MSVKRRGQRQRHVSGKVAAAILVIFLAVMLVQRFGQARDRLGANRLLAGAQAMTAQMEMRRQFPPTLLRQNLEYLKRAGELDPAEVAVPIAEGAQYFRMGRYKAAIRAYHRALAIEYRAEIFANLARCHLALGDRPAAVEAVEKAVVLDHTKRREFRDILRLERHLESRGLGQQEPSEN